MNGWAKTRLAEELLTWADRQGIAISTTHCYAAEGALAFAPITTWLRERPLAHLEPAWLLEVARLAPELVGPSAGALPAGPLTEAWQRQRFREALARAVLGPDLAQSIPLLLLIEDVQWCDCDTLEWLHYLLRLNPRARLLIVATQRPPVSRSDHALDDLLIDLRRRNALTEIDLKPLDRAHTIALAQQVAGRELDAATAAQIYQESEGVPLFVVEFMRAGLTLPLNVAADGLAILPPMVQAAVMTHLAQLSTPAQQVMELAAVIGREFTFEVLAAANGVAKDTLVQALDELWQRRVIREQGRDAYNFSHDKLRQVAYSRLSGIRRRQLHRQVAEALATLRGDRAGMSSGQIGWHYEQAGDDQSAAQWLLHAGEAATQVGAFSEALAYFERALDLIETTDLAGRYRVLLAREKLYHLQAMRQEQAHDLAELEKLAAALNDPCLQATVAVERGFYWLETSDFPAAIQAAQTALDFIKQAPQYDAQQIELARLEFESCHLWGTALICQGDAPSARVQVERALGLARAAGLQREQARALSNLGKFESSRPAAQAYLEAALPIYRQVSDQAGECTCLQSLGYTLLHQHEYARTAACYEQSLRLARQIGFRSAEADALYLLGHFYCHLGDWSAGKGYLAQALDMARANLNHRRAAYALFNLAVSHHGLEQHDRALEQVREAVTLCQSIGDDNAEAVAWLITGTILNDVEQWPAAAEALQRSLSIVLRLGDPAAAVYLRAKLAYTALGQGNVLQAQCLVDEILDYMQDGGDLIGTDEGPVNIYLYCFQVLKAFDDPRAATLIDTAYAYLNEQAAHVHTEALRRSFENKRENRQVIAAWKQMHGQPA